MSVQQYTTPNIRYDSIQINNQEISLSGSCKASFIAPYNRIDFVMTPLNCSLSYYEVRITTSNQDWDIGIGTKAYWDANIAGNTSYSFSININDTNFGQGDGTYRISLYGKSAVDGSWDVAYLLFDVNGGQFILQDGGGFEVLTTAAAPQED